MRGIKQHYKFPNIGNLTGEERKNYYSVKEYADIIGCTVSSLNKAIHKNELPGCVVGNSIYLIPKSIADEKT